MKYIILLSLSIFFMSNGFGAATAPGDYYVAVETLNVRASASPNGKITNRLSKNQKVEVFEVVNGWARVSKYYDGAVEGLSGEVARWASAKYFSDTRIVEKEAAYIDSPVANSIQSSDDYAKHQSTFLAASESLIEKGTCSLGDFIEMGGWLKSTSQSNKPIYFTYCDDKRIYLDASSGRTYR